MEDTPRKRGGFLSLTNLFRGTSTSAPEPEPQVQNAIPRNNGLSKPASLPSAQPKNASSSFESPTKRASESQLAGRKIGRPQAPSSKLSQSMSASDLTHQSSAPLKNNLAMGTPRRMPGDNPHKYQSSSFTSSAVAQTPANPYKSTNFSGAATAPRNLFRTSSIYQRAGISTFSPRVSTNSANQSFPPYTPGRTPRGSTADANSRALSNTTSAELFNMRIPSPPRELTGEVLAKEIPEGRNRSGSVYADEFLAHYCPSDLDEQQRRQFFCILDLRRLKYAADEVFVKKDWKINILNFAKEYEKSRSLIMLRYGLYEFKTVRASESVKKEWKQKHGIASSEDEDEPTSTTKPNGSKRKAEDQLVPSDIALTASSSTGNKRARAPTGAPVTNKRKATAVSEPDENQPASKLFKSTSATPLKAASATKSLFESIANNTTPAKPTPKSTSSSFVTSTPFGGSVFESDNKAPAPSKNIFGHLPDSSKGSGNDDADEESGDETNSSPEDEGSDAQEAGQSDEQSVAASGGVSTPQYGNLKPVTSMNGASSASSDAGDASQQGRSIFDRITRGADGQPVRQLTATDAPQLLPVSDKSRSVSPVKEQPAAPANNTWNAGTPIKFSSTGGNLFASTAAKPSTTSLGFAASSTKSAEPTAPPKETTKDSAAPNMFAASTKKPEEPATSEKAPVTQSGFSFPTTKPAEATSKSPMFGGLAAAPASGTPAFGSSTPMFGQTKATDEVKPAPAVPASTSNFFAPKPVTSATEPPKSVFQSSTLFGGQNKPEAEKTTQAQPGGLFGQSQTTETKPLQPQTSSLFGTSSSKPMFGSAVSSASDAEADQPAKKRAFGGADTKPATGFSFPSSTTTQKTEDPSTAKPLFGLSTTPAVISNAKPLFGTSATPAATSDPKPLFGSSATPAATSETKPVFGGFGVPASGAVAESKSGLAGFGTPTPATFFGQTAGAKPVTNMFGNTSSQPEAPKAGSVFGNVGSAAPVPGSGVFSFGSAQMSTAPATQQSDSQSTSGSIFGNVTSSFNFTSGGTDGAVHNPFAGGETVSAPSSFNFGPGTEGNTAQFSFGQSTAPSISFSGATDASSQNGMFSFGGTQPPSATPMFGNSLAPGGGTSTGTNTPFTFGGASSLATTPATGTPEPAAAAEAVDDNRRTNADGDEAPQEQISLIEGGPGEEDEDVVYEVRAKATKLVRGDDDSDKDKKGKPANPWKTQGVGPLRLMKHKTTGAVRILLRAEPRGHVAMNKAILPNFTYKPEAGGKYVKVTTSSDDGKSLETWMLQVKTPEMGKALAEALEKNKKANEK